MSVPHWIARPRESPSETLVANSMATIMAAMPASLIVLFALHLDALKKERATGHLGVEFHMHRGDVRSAVFNRRTSWQRTEAIETQRPAEPKP